MSHIGGGLTTTLHAKMTVADIKFCIIYSSQKKLKKLFFNHETVVRTFEQKVYKQVAAEN